MSACGTAPDSPYLATMSATWLPTIPPNHRHCSRWWARSSPTYIGAATQKVIVIGSRPALLAAVRTLSIIQAAMSTSASWRMKPSPTSPAALRANGPYAATQTSSDDVRAQGNCSVVPL